MGTKWNPDSDGGDASRAALLRCVLTAWFPSRPIFGVGYFVYQLREKRVELGGRGEIDRLVQIVRRAVIPLGIPLSIDRFFRRAVFVPENKRDAGNSTANKIVLIAASKEAPFGLGVVLDADAQGFRDLLHRIAQRRF